MQFWSDSRQECWTGYPSVQTWSTELVTKPTADGDDQRGSKRRILRCFWNGGRSRLGWWVLLALRLIAKDSMTPRQCRGYANLCRKRFAIKLSIWNYVLIYSTDVPNAQELLLRTKVDSIQRFISIIRPLKRVYKLPDATLHIFYNLTGPVIAFNAGGALFLNLRYFEGWRTFFPLVYRSL